MAAAKLDLGLSWRRVLRDSVALAGTATTTVGWAWIFRGVESWDHLEWWYRGSLLWLLGVLTSGILIYIAVRVRRWLESRHSTDHT